MGINSKGKKEIQEPQSSDYNLTESSSTAQDQEVAVAGVHNNSNNSNYEIDMLNGKLLKKLLMFAIPLALSSILQQVFNMVDMAIVGQFASSQDQAAVGGNGPVVNLIINIFIGISIGANVVIATYIGQKKPKKVSDVVHTTMLMAILCGLALMVIEIIVARPLLILMKTPDDVLDLAVRYLRIYAIGMPFFMIYNFGAAILRCIGDTRRPLYCLIASGILNAGLNMVLVIVFHMGVDGVAIATVTSFVLSAVVIVTLLCREKGPIKLSLNKLRIVKEELIRILRIGVPAGLQGMVFSVANVCIQYSINRFDSSGVAGSAIGLNFEYITYFVIVAFTQAVVTFTSQNFGAQQYKRCNEIYRKCMICSMIIILAMSWGIIFGRHFFVGLFTSNAEVAEYAIRRVLVVLPLNILVNTYEISGAGLRGMGYSMTPTIITVFGTCAFRIAWIWLVCTRFTAYETLMLIYPVSWTITGTAMVITYYKLRKKAYASGSRL